MYQNKTISSKTTAIKIASLGRQECQPAGTTKWAERLRFWKILGTTSVVKSILNLRNVVRCKIHRI